MYFIVSLLVYAVPFLVGFLLILLVVSLPALARSGADRRESKPRPQPTGLAVTGDHESFDPGFAGTPGFHPSH